MGADGHVFIYDLDKLKQIIPNFEPNKFGVYEREIFGHKVITQYTDYEWHDLYCLECGADYCKEHPQDKFKEALVDEWEVWT